ncbi:MAG: fatty acid desaturase [Acidimicrobiales bacterium]
MLRSLLLVFVVGFAVAQLAMFATTVYLHRALSHRSITVRPWVSAVFRVVLWMTTGIRPRQWVAVHRKHHAHTDVDGDPHSPVLRGWVRVQFGNVAMYRRVANDAEQVARFARDLPADRWDRWLLDRAWLGLSLGIGLLILVLGPWVGLAAAGLHTVVYLSSNAAVNAVGHTFGRRPHPNSATNLQWLAWLTMGEGLHNNHHAAPTSAKLAFARRQIDPAWPVIAVMRRLKLATIRHIGPLRRDAASKSSKPAAAVGS